MTSSQWRRHPPEQEEESDPLAGLGNLFDVSVVFIVGLMVALFATYRLHHLMDADSEVTVVKTNARGEKEILIKSGKKLERYRVGAAEGEGRGQRIGATYRLDDGQMIYVPDEGGAHAEP